MKPGDSVDVLKTESDSSLYGWTTGNIKEITKENIVIISLDGMPEENLSLALGSSNMAPYGYYTGGNDWREELKEESLIDCLDTIGVWYQATVLETELKEINGTTVKMVYVAFRRLDEDGPKTDDEGRRYNGWSDKYDEWINPYSLRIQKPGTIAKLGQYACKKALDDDGKENIDDTSDILLNSAEEIELFAVLRPETAKTAGVVDMLNMLGNKNGYENMIKRTEDTESFASNSICYLYKIDVVYYYIDILSEGCYMLHRKFLQSFVPRFSEAVRSFFLSIPDIEIRKMKKERLDNIIAAMDKILHRVYTVIDKHKYLEHFELDMCTRFLKSNYLQVRIDGLKGINDILKGESKGATRSIARDDLIDWAMKEKIVEELIGSKRHQQILQRSSALLQFIYSNLGFDDDVLEELWEFTKDESLKKDLFKILCEIAFPLHSHDLEFFANKITTMDPSEITEEALTVIFEPYKTPNHTNEQLLKYANMMTTIAFSGKYSLEISESAIQKYAEMVSTLDYESYRKDILLHYITEMIAKNHDVVLSLKLIRNMLNQCMEDNTVGLANTRADVINHLITEANLVQIFFNNFEWYYNTVKGKKEEEITIGRYNHSSNIMERIEFLSYLLTNCIPSYRLPIKYYYKLWDMLYESPICEDDTDFLFIFLRYITSNSTLVVFFFICLVFQEL